MTKIIKPEENLLISDLKKNPESFFDDGKSYDLLQEYFKGLALDSLNGLLVHENIIVRRVAIWIFSELGGTVVGLEENLKTLLQEDDRYIKYHALESVMMLSSCGSPNLFSYIISALESGDAVIRKLGMYLISNASNAQLNEAVEYFSKAHNQAHVEGLKFLLDDKSKLDGQVDEMLCNSNEIFKRYGVIFLKRNIVTTSQQSKIALKTTSDESIKLFLDDFLEIEGIK